MITGRADLFFALAARAAAAWRSRLDLLAIGVGSWVYWAQAPQRGLQIRGAGLAPNSGRGCAGFGV